MCINLEPKKMILVDRNSIKGIYPHKGGKCFKLTNAFGKQEWLSVDAHKPAFRYSDSYLTVPPSAVHPDDLPHAEYTRRGDEVYLKKGLRLIAPYKVGVHDGPDSWAFTVNASEHNPVVIQSISYGNAHVANTVWYTDGTELSHLSK